jgi:hypothetical protein
MDDVRALTLRQPWASLVMLTHPGRKDVENRAWATGYRGPLVIHAGMGLDRDGYADAARLGLDVTGLPRGVCLGVVDLVDVVQGHESRWALPGHWHWLVNRPRVFPQPVPAQGRLRLWVVPAGVAAAVTRVGGTRTPA